MCVGDGAPFCARVAGAVLACSVVAWGGRATLLCKLRVGTANCIAGGCKGCIRAAEQRFCNRFPQRGVWTTQWCCTRARGERGLRDAELHRLTNERLGCQSDARNCAGSNSLVFWFAFIRNKAATGPEGGIPQIAPAEHALVHSGIDGAPQSLQRNRRSGHTVTRGCVTPSARTTRVVLPRSHHHNNSAGAAEHSAQKRVHFEQRRRRGPGNESTGADPKRTK